MRIEDHIVNVDAQLKIIKSKQDLILEMLREIIKNQDHE
jgi:hypothetical protein